MFEQRLTRLSAVMLLCAALAACGKAQTADATAEAAGQKEEEQAPAVPVEVAVALSGDITARYAATGTLEAEHDAEVVAKVGGVVQDLLVEEGDRVQAGQVLAKLDDARLRIEVARAEANLAKLEQEYRRNRRLYESQLVSAETFERLGHEMEAMRAELDLARLQLEYTEIRAPFDGIVAERHVKIGNMVELNSPAFRVTTYDPLIIRLHVPERELSKLAKGQPAALRVDALPAEIFSGVVDRVSPVVDSNTGTFAVTVAVRGEGKLKPGMFGRVAIVHDTRSNAVLVPRSAVMVEDARSSVFVVSDGKAERRSVVTGYVNDGMIEIVDGIAPGDWVITVGQNSLKNGARVAAVNSPLPEPGPELDAAEQVAAVE